MKKPKFDWSNLPKPSQPLLAETQPLNLTDVDDVVVRPNSSKVNAVSERESVPVAGQEPSSPMERKFPTEASRKPEVPIPKKVRDLEEPVYAAMKRRK